MTLKLNPETRTFMERHGISGYRLARLAKVDRRTVTRWLNGGTISGDSALTVLEAFSEFDPSVVLNDVVIRED